MNNAPLGLMAERLHTLEGANLRLATWYLNAFGTGAPLPLEHDSNDVARAVGVSRATVIRFARMLGFSGFSAFRNALFQYDDHTKSIGMDEDHPDKPQGLMDVTALQVAAINESLQLINSNAFQQAVSWLAQASSVLWIGWGDSYYAAASGEHKCRLGGFSARSANDVADLGLHVGSLGKDAVIMVVSQSGRWQAIVEAVNSAKERGIKVICLCGSATSALAMAADLTFITANPTYRVAGHPYTLRAAQITLIDALILEAVRAKGISQIASPGSL